MADKSSTLRGFNTHIMDFLDDIAGIIENNEDILASKTFFETVKKANPTMLIKCWHMYVYLPYKEVIDTCNIDYFLEKDYMKDTSVLVNSEEIMKSIDKIRNPIKEMTDVNKQHSMNYIKNLSKLSSIYNGKDV